MVDFNAESTISKAPIEIVNLIVIEHWYNYINAWEYYVKMRLDGAKPSISILRARLSSLFCSCSEMLLRKMDKEKEDYADLYTLCTDPKIEASAEEIQIGFNKINHILDIAGLINIDIRAFVKRLNVEDSNKADGY